MSRETLSRSGLTYTEGSEKARLSRRSRTGGHAATLFDSAQNAKRIIGAALPADSKGLVLSNEGLLTRLAEDGTRKHLHETIGRHGFSETRILVYLREPIHLGVSYWLQRVKCHGETDDLDDFLRKSRFIQEYMALTAEVLEYLSSQDGFGIHALNYATQKSDILSSVSAWLDIDRGNLSNPDAARVDRSLNPGEARLQLEFNRLLGPHASFLGKALTEGGTDMEPEKPAPCPELQYAIWEETAPWVKRINRFLPEGQGLVFDRLATKEYTEGYVFTEEQIRVIAETLGGEIWRYWDSETKTMSFIRKILRFLRERQ